MPRLTRQESQHHTRQKLIEAAEKEILRLGVFDASIRQICEVAGHTLGAFYSNFKDKNELLLEVVALHSQRGLEALNDLTAATPKLDSSKIMNNVSSWLRELQKDKVLSGLSLEFEVYANHNPSFKKKYNEDKKHWHAELANALDALFKGQGLAPKISTQHMALGLSALWNGFAIEGSVPGIEPADKIIPLFLGALLENAKG